MKAITSIHQPPTGHWVGDGFPVRSLFSYADHGRMLDPFLLLDFAGPADFTPSPRQRGVGEHPHRGFETVTIVYEGALNHRDSGGGGGYIGPGDVQWMTAGAGVVHEELHSPEFSARGGRFRAVQLWVNLPAADKLTTPRYQSLRAAEMPWVELPNQAGRLQIIAGNYQGQSGTASTFSPLDLWSVDLAAKAELELPLPEGRRVGIVVLEGVLRVNDSRDLAQAHLAILDRQGCGVRLQTEGPAQLLVLHGEPLAEPVAGYGPFVMNTREQIEQAIADYRDGRFGQLVREHAS